MKRRLLRVLPRLFGVVLLVVILWRIDGRKLAASLAGSLSWPLALALGLYPIFASLRALRWRAILAQQGVRYDFLTALRIYYATVFLGTITPGRLGELSKAAYLKRDHALSFGRAVASTLVDRLHDVSSFLVVATVFLFVRGQLVEALVLAALCTMLAIGLGSRRLGLAFVGVLPSRLGDRISPRVTAAYDALAEFATRDHLRPIALTLLGSVLFYGIGALLMRAAGVAISTFDSAGTQALGVLAAILPLSILGIGARDATVTAVYVSLAIPNAAEHAVAYSTLHLAVFTGVAAIGGSIAFALDPIRRRVDAPSS